MMKTRTCRECRVEYSLSGLHFKQIYAGKAVTMDTLCRDCRERIGPREWDVLHDNVTNEPTSLVMKGFGDRDDSDF